MGILFLTLKRVGFFIELHSSCEWMFLKFLEKEISSPLNELKTNRSKRPYRVKLSEKLSYWYQEKIVGSEQKFISCGGCNFYLKTEVAYMKWITFTFTTWQISLLYVVNHLPKGYTFEIQFTLWKIDYGHRQNHKLDNLMWSSSNQGPKWKTRTCWSFNSALENGHAGTIRKLFEGGIRRFEVS